MRVSTTLPDPPTLTLRLDPIIELDDDQLFDLCQRNRDLRIERTASGKLVLMTPAGGETSGRNAAITSQLWMWARRDGTGQVFDSSGGFLLPDGAMRSPDAAWVERRRLRRLPKAERQRFLPLCPTFVIELRSPSDPLEPLRSKLREYLENGTRLGWLIDPGERRVEIYRPEAEAEILEEPASVSGDPELPGFVLELDEIWDPGW